MKSNEEKLYTSTTSKLLHNLDRLEEFKQGIFRPISIQLAPTDKCNLNCIFCSVKDRPMKELSLDECINTLTTFKKLGAKTVEITGGGDSTMYPHINQLINIAYDLGYKIGVITNGVLLNKKVTYDNIKKLTWVRVSLNCLDYIENIILDIPDNVTLGFSYVWNDFSNMKILDKIKDYSNKYDADYVRIVPDCLDVKKIEKFKKDIANTINMYPGFFFQQKEYTVPSRCRMGYIKPFVNSDGYIYHCSANPLINRQFNDKFRICHINDIEESWKNPVPFDTSNCQKGKCFFKEHNELIEEVILDIKHKEFI